MRVDVLFTPKELRPEHITGRAVVVFDVLRATTTMTAGLAVGIGEIRVFDSLDEARAAAAEFTGPKLLCGERHTVPPEGFDLGNSPGQFTREHAGRMVFMSTTNGTRALVAAKDAKLLLAGALVNAGAVAKRLAAAGLDVTLLCAGSDGETSMEDTLGAGAVLTALESLTAVEITFDPARVARRLFAACWESLPAVLADSFGGHNIRRVHLDADIAFAARLDLFSVVGEVRGGPMRVIAASDF